jgi:hypothetical protein
LRLWMWLPCWGRRCGLQNQWFLPSEDLVCPSVADGRWRRWRRSFPGGSSCRTFALCCRLVVVRHSVMSGCT